MESLMKVFTAGELIDNFLLSCANCSEEKDSLRKSLKWEVKSLKRIHDHFATKIAQNPGNELSDDNKKLLGDTSRYFEDLFDNALQIRHKIRGDRVFRDDKAPYCWFATDNDFGLLSKELDKWKRRFRVRVLGLDGSLTNVIHTDDQNETPAIIKSHNKLRDFTALDDRKKKARGKQLFSPYTHHISERISRSGDLSSAPLEYGTKQLIFSTKPLPPDFQALTDDTGILAAAFNCLDTAAEVRLLRVKSYFVHPDTKQLLLTHIPPPETQGMMTLKTFIERDNNLTESNIPLSQKLKLAYKLAEAVFFLYTANFLHKNIRSSNVIIFHRADFAGSLCSSLDDAYLISSDLIRNGGRENQQPQDQSSDSDISQDSDLSEEPRRREDVKNYDIYSLGILLLEIGLWKTLSNRRVRGMVEQNPDNWREPVSEEELSELRSRINDRYSNSVKWCMGLEAKQAVPADKYVEHVLRPLDGIEIGQN